MARRMRQLSRLSRLSHRFPERRGSFPGAFPRGVTPVGGAPAGKPRPCRSDETDPGKGNGKRLTAMTSAGPKQLTCDGCGRDLPVLTDEELAALPDLAPALCEECLQMELVELRRMARGGDR